MNISLSATHRRRADAESSASRYANAPSASAP
ncbi:hypothetical protein BPC006_II0611 [Burkholderia pseudomallei BPC006]|nr:hypothetical protein BPC006_II0611 [Burkholderia pseudomallei BPC006]